MTTTPTEIVARGRAIERMTMVIGAMMIAATAATAASDRSRDANRWSRDSAPDVDQGDRNLTGRVRKVGKMEIVAKALVPKLLAPTTGGRKGAGLTSVAQKVVGPQGRRAAGLKAAGLAPQRPGAARGRVVRAVSSIALRFWNISST